MVKIFKGKVHVSDVKKEFDILVAGINEIIDAYNSSDYITKIDYNDVSADLAPSGYTLSVGGLKKMLKTYSGRVLGCAITRDMEKNKLIVSNGLYISETGGRAIPSTILSYDKNKKTLYYDLANKVFSFDKVTSEGSGGAQQEIEKEFIQPVLTSNNSWGTVTADISVGDAFKAFDNNPATYWAYNNNNTLTWTFQDTLSLDNVTVTILNGTGQNDLTRAKDITVYGITSDNKDIRIGVVSATLSEQGSITRSLPVIADTKRFKGIKFECTSHNVPVFGYTTGRIAEVKLTGKIITTVEQPALLADPLPAEWIKVADTNFNRDIIYSNTQGFWCEDVKNLSITVGNNGSSWTVQQTLDNSKNPVFVGASTPNYRTEDNNFVHLFGVPVSNFHPASKEHIGGASKPKLFLPKGIPNPYQIGWGSNQFLVYPANIEKKKDK